MNNVIVRSARIEVAFYSIQSAREGQVHRWANDFNGAQRVKIDSRCPALQSDQYLVSFDSQCYDIDAAGTNNPTAVGDVVARAGHPCCHTETLSRSEPPDTIIIRIFPL